MTSVVQVMDRLVFQFGLHSQFGLKLLLTYGGKFKLEIILIDLQIPWVLHGT